MWVNLLEYVYPVGSIYLSILDNSPASIVGGTWKKIEGALLGFAGGNYGSVDNYNGSNFMTTEQMPSHNHANPVAVMFGGDAAQSRSIFATNSDFWNKADWNNATAETGGGARIYPAQLYMLWMGSHCLNYFFAEVISNGLD